MRQASPCADTFSSTELSAFVVDPSAQTNSSVTHTFELWPSADPTEVTAKTVTSFLGYLGRDRVPDTELSDGTQYSFRVQAQTTSGMSPWTSAVRIPLRRDASVDSDAELANYPEETWGPPGEPVQFTFDGNGDPDVAGFDTSYSWGTVPLYACEYSGPHGERGLPGRLRAARLRPCGQRALRVFDVEPAGRRTAAADHQSARPGG